MESVGKVKPRQARRLARKKRGWRGCSRMRRGEERWGKKTKKRGGDIKKEVIKL